MADVFAALEEAEKKENDPNHHSSDSLHAEDEEEDDEEVVEEVVVEEVYEEGSDVGSDEEIIEEEEEMIEEVYDEETAGEETAGEEEAGAEPNSPAPAAAEDDANREAYGSAVLGTGGGAPAATPAPAEEPDIVAETADQAEPPAPSHIPEDDDITENMSNIERQSQERLRYEQAQAQYNSQPSAVEEEDEYPRNAATYAGREYGDEEDYMPQPEEPAMQNKSRGGGDDENGGSSARGVALFCICLCCCVIIAAAIVIPVLLLDDDPEVTRAITTQAPTLPPKTFAPTPAPTPSFEFGRIGGPFAGPAGSGFGTSAAISGNLMTVGAPDEDVVYSFVDNGSQWLPNGMISSPLLSGVGLGTTLDMAGNGLIIGAPFFVSDPDLEEPFGAALLYEYDGSTWVNLGLITDETAPLNADEELGGAVAIAEVGNIYRMVVAAPTANLALTLLQAGRIMTYETSTDGLLNEIPHDAIVGSASGDLFGSAVDLSADGSTLVIGAPGSGAIPGYINVYEWANNDWSEIFTDQGAANGDDFGVAANFLSSTGSVVAVGEPGFEQGSGRVVVYVQSGNSYMALTNIIGASGERLGATVGGSSDGTNHVVIAGTASGDVKRFDYISNAWAERYAPTETGLESITALSTSGPDIFVAADPGSNEATIYQANVGDRPVPQSTLAPTGAPLRWMETGVLPSLSTEDIGFGASVAIGSTRAAIGAPLEGDEVGRVYMYEKDADGVWSNTQSITNEEAITRFGRFGSSIEMSDTLLVVGAPTLVRDEQEEEPFGAVFAYEYTGGLWQLLGTPMVGNRADIAVDETFGAAIAASDNGRIVVGGPGSNIGEFFAPTLAVGAIYIYEFSANDWSLIAWIQGAVEDARLGTAVDISSDGMVVAAGAPGNQDGVVRIYEYNGEDWPEIDAFTGDNNEALGTTVKFLSEDGGIVVAGGPSLAGNQGLIVAYERGSNGLYSPMGESIRGGAGDRIGASQAIAADGMTPSFILTTSSGLITTWEFDGTEWVMARDPVASGYSPTVVAAGADNMSMIVGGASAEAASIYEYI